MLIRQGEEVDPLGPEELRKDEKRFVGMLPGESEARSPRLAPRPARRLGPYHPIPLAVGAYGSAIELDEKLPVNNYPVIKRGRHLLEFEGGENTL